MLCGGDQRDRDKDVQVSLDPEILCIVLGGQRFLWEVVRRKEERAFLSLPFRQRLALTAANCFFQSQNIARELETAKAVQRTQLRRAQEAW